MSLWAFACMTKFAQYYTVNPIKSMPVTKSELHFLLGLRSEFSNERNRVERRQEFKKMRKKENFYRAIEGYFNWIVEAGGESLEN